MDGTDAATSVLWSVVLFASVGASIWLAHWLAPERVVGEETSGSHRTGVPRPGDPVAAGTGLENPVVLAWSPSDLAGARDPRPRASARLQPPAGAVAIHAVPAGPRRRVVIHGR